MTSQAQAAEPMPGVRALAFLGFPLHPAGRPSNERAAHLAEQRRRHAEAPFERGTQTRRPIRAAPDPASSRVKHGPVDAATPSGAAINTSGSQSGTQTATAQYWSALASGGDRYDIAAFATDRPASGETIAEIVQRRKERDMH